MSPSRWLPKVLERTHALAGAGKIRMTGKAMRELIEVGIGLGPHDVRDVLCGLKAKDSAGRFRSETTKEWMYVWKPEVFGTLLYIKLILRGDCVVVSFHEDSGGGQ